MRSGIILLLLFVTVFLSAQKPEVSAELERDSIQIGEQINFKINLESEYPLKSLVPDVEKALTNGIEIIESKIDSTKAENYSYAFRYLITSFDSGFYKIPSVEILYNDGRIADTVFTLPAILTVYTPIVDTTEEIKDIKGVFKSPVNLNEILSYWKIYTAIILLIAIILASYYYLIRKPGIMVEPVRVPPHVKAINKLDRIKSEKLWQQGKVKEYYSELSNTVRQYIEERFEIPAMESITSEILEDFKKFSYDDEYLMEILENMLNLSDLVKFAKEDPAPSENETNLSQAYILVEKTKPVETLKKEEA
jgi:hypothetical protein